MKYGCTVLSSLVSEGSYTIKVDSYSFGKMMYELITKSTSPASLGDPTFYANSKDSQKTRVKIPRCTDDNIQKLIASCCNLRPGARPNFEVISNELLKLYDFYLSSEREKRSSISGSNLTSSTSSTGSTTTTTTTTQRNSR